MTYNYLITIVCEYMTVSTAIESDIEPDYEDGHNTMYDDVLLEEALEQIRYQYKVDLTPFIDEFYWEER
jgi:hypothetical protein